MGRRNKKVGRLQSLANSCDWPIVRARHVYWFSARQGCPIKAQCTTGKERRVRRWEHEAVIDQMQARLDADPEKMRVRRQTVEHPFGTIKGWMGWTHFQTKTLKPETESAPRWVFMCLPTTTTRDQDSGVGALSRAIRRLKAGCGSQTAAISAA